jgi:glyoxylase-like metal-dependent hydrolase (beta-lactamase superfamily II)
MEQIARDVYRLQGLRISNVYAVVSEQGIVLIDSGSPGEVNRILAQLQQAGFGLSDLRAVVLTHAHSDHIGGAAELARRSGAQILAHRDEVPYLDGTKTLPATSLVTRLLTWGTRLMPGTRTRYRVDEVLQEGDSLEHLGGLRVIHTPGHTPGSICLYRPEGRILFCGDLLLNGHPLTGRGRLRFSIPQFSVDAAQARRSVEKLLELPFEILCFGHGEPLLVNAGRSVRELLNSGV